MSNTDLATAVGSLSNADILYSASGNNITLGNATNTTANLITNSANTFTVNGTFSSVSGGTDTVTFNGPTVLNSTGITTSGSQTYNGATTVDTTTTLQTTGSGSNITIGSTGSISWLANLTASLNLTSANDIIINGPINSTGGTGSLNLSAINSSQSITTGSGGTINLANFNLLQGQWFQVTASLPTFNITNNFQIDSGTMPNSVATFIRATSGQWH